MKKRISFAIICVIIVGMLLSIMVFTPQKKARYIENSGDVVKTVSLSNEEKVSDTIYEFTVEGYGTKYIAIKLKGVVTDIAEMQVYVDYGNGYELSGKKNVSVSEEGQYGYTTLNSDQYRKIRIESDPAYAIDQIEFHRTPHNLEITSVKPFKVLILLSIIVLIGVFFAGYFIQSKVDVIEYVKLKLINAVGLKWHFLKSISYIAIAGIIAFTGSSVLSLIKDKAWSFNGQQFVWILAGVLVVMILVLNRKNIEANINRVLFLLIVTIGGALIIITPASHKTWDIDSHYRWALIDSYLGRGCLTQADLDVFNDYDESLVGGDKEESKVKEEMLNNDHNYVIANDYEIVSLPHLVAGIAMAIARFFRGSFVCIFKAGEWANLLLYAALCYIGIKRLKVGKMILAVVALFPTNLMIATNYSYDYWIIGLTIVGVAYFIGNCQESKGYISTKDTIIMAGALALACIPKQIYIMLMIIPFFMPRAKIKDKRKYYGICLTGFAILFIMLLFRSMATTGGTGDVRGGAVMPMEQIKYILYNMGAYACTLFGFLKEYLSVLDVKEYTMDFAYYGMGTNFVHVMTILLIITAITDKDRCDNYKTATVARIYVIATYFITAALIATALYITYTPVGASEIAGCQPRYLIPLIYPLAAIVGSGKINNRMDKRLYYYGIIAISTFILYYSMYDVVLRDIIA
jgi:uncharacterized membrane protein